MTNFFKSIKTFKELKDAYRKFARELHPDKPTGDAEKFKSMKSEYDRLFKKMKDGNFDTESERQKHTNVNYDFQSIIDKLIFVDGGDIEIIGDWIWVWGIKSKDTEQHNQLKAIGLRYSKGKNAWYFKGTAGKWRKSMTKDQMRDTFGSQKIGKGTKPLID
jgi:curved DNA-binding protein CbpA